MKIELHEIPIKDVVKNYVDNAENGVIGYDGKLNIRPKYQREFVYGEKERNAVITTINKGFPLNVMYWVKNEDGTFEVLDGQQRTVSFCQYINNDFSVEVDVAGVSTPKKFGNLTQTEKDRILDYKLLVYFCEGNDEERLAWFRVINIAGLKLTEQELRNANYTGTWLTSAKSYFSKNNCVASLTAKGYYKAEVNRQGLLELALKWISAKENKSIEQYMLEHQHDENADELWFYFKNVIDWVKVKFKKYRREMCGLDWGLMYNEFSSLPLDANKLEEEISRLMLDSEVENKKGIYLYVLSRKLKYLNLRQFDDDIKRQKYEMQKGICPHCVAEHREKTHYEYEEMEGDHITPWVEGGKTNIDNCQMLCKEHNRRKSNL